MVSSYYTFRPTGIRCCILTHINMKYWLSVPEVGEGLWYLLVLDTDGHDVGQLLASLLVSN